MALGILKRESGQTWSGDDELEKRRSLCDATKRGRVLYAVYLISRRHRPTYQNACIYLGEKLRFPCRRAYKSTQRCALNFTQGL